MSDKVFLVIRAVFNTFFLTQQVKKNFLKQCTFETEDQEYNKHLIRFIIKVQIKMSKIRSILTTPGKIHST